MVKEAKVESVMGAYNAVRGEPCCGNKTLLIDILREKWGFKGHVVSDCWAIRDFHTNYMVTKKPAESAALAIRVDVILTVVTLIFICYRHTKRAGNGRRNYKSCERLMTTRIKLGMFDECEYDKISYLENDSKEHHEIALMAARKSVVLLKMMEYYPLIKIKLKRLQLLVLMPIAVKS